MTRLFFSAIAVVLLLAAFGPAVAGAQHPGEPGRNATLYDRMLPCTADVLVDGRHGGSCWFADPSGLVITAAHVLQRPGRQIEILLASGDRLEAQLAAVDLGGDLALLKLPPRNDGYPAAPLASAVPPPGERVFLVGSGLFRRGLLFDGLVGQRGTRFEYNSTWNDFGEVVHICGTIVQGTSGACWFNAKGEVVGVQSSTFSVNSVPTGMANMTPVGPVRRLLQTRRNAATPTLGMAVHEIWQQAPDYLKRFPPKTEGLVIRRLVNDGPAARAGLKELDLVTAIEGQPARSVDRFMRTVRAKQPGQSFTLHVLDANGSGSREANVILGKLEAGWPESPGEN
jgi:serine protease Do